MAGVKRPLGDVASAQQRGNMEKAPDGRQIDTSGMSDQQRAAYGLPLQMKTASPVDTVDTYRIVDFVKALPMHDERGMEVRIDRAIVGRSVNRESAAKVASIVLDGGWFAVTVATGPEATTGAVARTYRVPLSNVVSAER